MVTTSPFLQGGSENLLNIGNVCIAVDWAIKQAGRGQASHRSCAVKVEVFQGPCGTASTTCW
jgi:hypothetical protein